MLDFMFHEFADVALWNWTLQALGITLAVAGAYENAKGKIHGFHLWIASNVFMAVLHAHAGLWGLFVLDFVFTLINFKGMRVWAARSQAQDDPIETNRCPVQMDEDDCLLVQGKRALSAEQIVQMEQRRAMIERIIAQTRDELGYEHHGHGAKPTIH